VFIFFNLLFKKVHCSMFKNVYCLLFIVQKVHSSLFKKVFSLLFIVYCSKKFKKFKKVYPVGYLFLFSLRCSMGLSYGVNCSMFKKFKKVHCFIASLFHCYAIATIEQFSNLTIFSILFYQSYSILLSQP